jgi:tyrosyl-tRNA synthetase
MNALNILRERGFLQSSTDEGALDRFLAANPQSFYVGFDPTGNSLHVGHLVPVMVMAWLARLGHQPIAIIGGGTAKVGDPSGKDKTRTMLDDAAIHANSECFRIQLTQILSAATEGAEACPDLILIDNSEWLNQLNYIEFLRDIGQHFSVNRMLSAESAKQRLERNQGLSFIEFNYHLLQSYDFLVLNQRYGCGLQVGGDDQWFNILGGVDLIRRVAQKEAHALTVPLLATADGKKMGKTEKGAVWIDPAQCSPFDYFQYWLNVHDDDAIRFLKLYTFLDMEQISELAQLTGSDIRKAKRVLALEATSIVHGRSTAQEADRAARALFEKGAGANAPTLSIDLPVSVIDALVQSDLAKSKGAARRLIQQGGVRIESDRVTDIETTITQDCTLWAGKKRAVQIRGN